jgi:hypothetical protein
VLKQLGHALFEAFKRKNQAQITDSCVLRVTKKDRLRRYHVVWPVRLEVLLIAQEDSVRSALKTSGRRSK